MDLWSFIEKVTEETADILRAAHYPSLYGNYVLAGPLCLVNHSCKSHLGFAKRKLATHVVPQLKNTVFLYACHTRKQTLLPMGEEFFVDYFSGATNSDFSPCLCAGCQK